MARKIKRAQRTRREERAQTPAPEDKQARHRMRALIISTLAAGGVFQMNSWQVQAHGNRSSHSVLAFQNVFFSPDDYVLMRQVLTAPNANETTELLQIVEQLRKAEGKPDTPELKNLRERRAAIEQKLRLRATSSRALDFLRNNDADAVVAAIEGEGWIERVLGEYLWVLLDVAYLGRKGDVFTTQHLKEFTLIARPAVAYSERVLKTLPAKGLTPQQLAAKERIAEILHNVASFIIVPENGPRSTEDLTLGRTAAERALQLRRELNQQPETMRGLWMLAQYHLDEQPTTTAQRHLREALALAEKIKDQPGIAWSKHSLARALAKSSPAQSKQLAGEARQIVQQFKGRDTTIDFLRIELKQA